MVLRVYADGVFDLFHYGHAKLLEQAKKCHDDVYLIVGVCQDNDVHEHKGPTVMTHAERCECVRYCKYVDEVLAHAPWIIDEEFMNMHRIDLVVHDGDLYPTFGVEDAYEVPKRLGKFFATTRTEGISTTSLINRILDKSNVYFERNSLR